MEQPFAAWIAEDDRVREELGVQHGYPARMREVHDRNADALEAWIDAHGGVWPVSPDAWRIAQHAIAKPRFQRRVLALLRATPGVPLAEIAMLEDRIRVFEGRKQVYGTQFDWDENGEMSPAAMEDPDGVDERRASVGLGPLAQRIEEMRRDAGPPPADPEARRREAEQWAREVGWRA